MVCGPAGEHTFCLKGTSLLIAGAWGMVKFWHNYNFSKETRNLHFCMKSPDFLLLASYMSSNHVKLIGWCKWPFFAGLRAGTTVVISSHVRRGAKWSPFNPPQKWMEHVQSALGQTTRQGLSCWFCQRKMANRQLLDCQRGGGLCFPGEDKHCRQGSALLMTDYSLWPTSNRVKKLRYLRTCLKWVNKLPTTSFSLSPWKSAYIQILLEFSLFRVSKWLLDFAIYNTHSSSQSNRRKK